MSKILIVFDIDGTLVHSNRIDSICFARTYQKTYGRPFPSIDWTYYPHVTDTSIFNTVIKEHFKRIATADEIRDFQDSFVELLNRKREEQPEEFKEVPYAKATIDRLLSDDHFVVGIATGGWQKPALLKLNHVGIQAEKLILSCADGKITREAIIQEVIDSPSVKQHQINRIVYVGDAVWDVHTTRNMQINFIGIRVKGDLEQLSKHGARHVLHNYSNYSLFLEMVKSALPPLPLPQNSNE